MTGQAHTGRPSRLFRNLNAKIASIPMMLTAVVIFLGGTIWTVVYSFTNSKLLPRAKFVGFDQYERLWSAPRWIVSIENLAIYGVFTLVFSLVMGFVLAALMDQKIRFENTFRTIFLYPFALSFIVTGLVWQWILNPEFGVQSVVRALGWLARVLVALALPGADVSYPMRPSAAISRNHLRPAATRNAAVSATITVYTAANTETAPSSRKTRHRTP